MESIMSNRQKISTTIFSILLALSFFFPLLFFITPIQAASLSVTGGEYVFKPGETKTITVTWQSSEVLEGIWGEFSASNGFSISARAPVSSDDLTPLSTNSVARSFADSPRTSGILFELTVTADAGATSGDIAITSEGYPDGISVTNTARSTYSLSVQAPTPTTAAPTPTPTATTTVAPTTTTTPAATTTKATTAATTAATTSATQTTTEDPTTAETTTEETTTAETTTAEATTTTAQHFTLTGNGVQDTFALMPANDVSAPLGFSKTSGSFQGVDATLFTRAGSLPLVYGALSNDATPLFYVYDATNSALYNFFNDIILQADNKSWTVSPMAVPAPGPEFRYRSISINGQPMSVYEAQISGSKQTLIYAAEYGQTDKSLYLYNASNPSGALVKYDPAIKPSSSPSSTTAAGLISITTTQPPSSANKGGIDFLTILLIIVFVALASGLAYVAYLNKARIMAIFTQSVQSFV